MRWLTLLTSLPRTPTRHRVGVWRKLQRMGAVRLRSAGWILPETPETTELFQWLAPANPTLPDGAPLLGLRPPEHNAHSKESRPLPHTPKGDVHSAGTGRPGIPPARPA